jgi:hypothetical protein
MGKFKQYINAQHIKIDILFEAYEFKITSFKDVDTKISNKSHNKFAKELLSLLQKLDKDMFDKITNLLSYQKSDGKIKVNPDFGVYSTQITKLFKVKFGKGSTGKRKMPQGMTATIFFETFAVLGFLSNSNDPEKLMSIKHDEIFSIGSVDDFDAETVKEGMRIASSSMNFSKGFSVKDVIHKSIDTFYAKLTAFEGIDKIKENTSDIVVITKGSKNELFSALDKKEVISYTDDGEITVGKVKFYQISLKASKKARLGRVTTLFNNMYKGDSSYDDIFNENWKDSLSVIGNMSKKVYISIRSGITNLMNRFAKMFSASNVKKECDKIASKDKEIQAYLKLNEGSIPKSYDLNKLRKSMEANFTALKSYESKDIETRIVLTKLDEPKTVQETNLLLVNKIASSYLLKVLADVKAQGGSKYIQSIIDLMRKGSTKLPVVMLYGDNNSEVLIEIPAINTDSLPSVVVSIHKSDSSNAYYVVYLYFLTELNETLEDSIYTNIQFSNAGGSTLSFKAEGYKNFKYKNIS